MSLLDLGPDVVTVYADTVTTTDGYGNKVKGPAASGTDIRGRWQPSTAEETAELGQQTTTVYRFLCRDFPAGPWSRATFDGSTWDVVGEPRRHRGSETTRHVTVYFRKR